MKLSKAIKFRIIITLFFYIAGSLFLLYQQNDSRTWNSIIIAGVLILISNIYSIRKQKAEAALETPKNKK